MRLGFYNIIIYLLICYKKANEDSKKKRQAEELQRRREEAMKKYGMDPSQFAAFSERGRGGARGKGRGKRGGRGAASIGDRDEVGSFISQSNLFRRIQIIKKLN